MKRTFRRIERRLRDNPHAQIEMICRSTYGGITTTEYSINGKVYHTVVEQRPIPRYVWPTREQQMLADALNFGL